jgi:hypothetical protein
MTEDIGGRTHSGDKIRDKDREEKEESREEREKSKEERGKDREDRGEGRMKFMSSSRVDSSLASATTAAFMRALKSKVELVEVWL